MPVPGCLVGQQGGKKTVDGRKTEEKEGRVIVMRYSADGTYPNQTKLPRQSRSYLEFENRPACLSARRGR